MFDPLTTAEAARKHVTSALDPIQRSKLGQFFTPAATARLMASMSTLTRKQMRFLDAGAGLGALTAAWVAEICSRPVPPDQVCLRAYEVDAALLPALRQTLAECERACMAAGITCDWEVRTTDFIDEAVDALDGGLFRSDAPKFDVAILNPPYKKFRTESRTRRLLRRVNIETSNLYTAFLALVVLLLDDGGELIAITPRSFCNGPYFRPFRQHLLRHVSLTGLHVFEARDHAFRDDEVLQENVILHAVKAVPQQPMVRMSQSQTPDDPTDVERNVPFERVVRPSDSEAFIRLVAHENGHTFADAMQALPCTLDELGLCVSTGRVVDFRARQWLRSEPMPGTVPLIHPTHFDLGVVRWPKAGTKKPNAIMYNANTADLAIPAGVYVLVKRFSAKEERRRVMAAVFDDEQVRCDVVGFENHLNYFHARGLPLDRSLAWGLAAFLNCSPLDSYFRQFNGHTQVNATDLRSLRYPRRDALTALGRATQGALPPQHELDAIVAAVLELADG
ncbi:MAG: Eco57I restriction-modification methylase domain-containing protein [Gammaproteobacteria bacterium]